MSVKKGLVGALTSKTERLCALTDGVYAIVITLLVLDLKAPEAADLSEAQLITDLIEHIPNFLSYLISFLAIAVFWIRHHGIFRFLERCNTTTFGLNFLHILLVSLTPYTASLFGQYEEDPLVVVLFSGSLGLAGLSLLLMHRYVASKPEWHSAEAPDRWKAPNWFASYPGPLFALCSVLIAFFNVTAAVVVWLFLPILALVVSRRSR